MSDLQSGLAERMDGDYQPPILTEPAGGPIPQADLDEVLAAGKRFDPSQKRDGDGKWTRTGGATSTGDAPADKPAVVGNTAVGRPLKVRGALAKAKTVAEVEAVAAAEVTRLRGHDRAPVEWGFASDSPHGVWEASAVTTAREHAEGVLRVVEEFPRIALGRVRHAHPYEDARMADGVYAYAKGGDVVFNLQWSSDNGRRAYLAALKESTGTGWHPAGSQNPIATAIHEAGHVLDIHTLGEAAHFDAVTAYRAQAKKTKGAPVSTYAATSAHELVAESFADVMVNGVAADPTSRKVFVAVAQAYQDAVDADDDAKRGTR